MISIKENNDAKSKKNNDEKTSDEIECFVIMPITDRLPYQEGHFKIVYEHVIKPACKNAGFSPKRSDEVNQTNFIVKDILKKLLDSPMAICDLSGQNPNVLFELGIRQAFNKPVTIIKDIATPRIFDIDGIRYIDYDENLRIDNINLSVKKIEENLKNTYDSKENSLIESLSIKPAQILEDLTLSNDTSVLLDAIEGLKDKIDISNSKRFAANSKVNMDLEQMDLGQLQFVITDSSGNTKIIPADEVKHSIWNFNVHKEFKPRTKSSLTKSCLNENPNENKTPK